MRSLLGLFTLLVIVVVAQFAAAQDLSGITARSNEVRNLQALACPAPGAATTSRSAAYQEDLKAAVGELRDQIKAFRNQVQQAGMPAETAAALTKWLDPQASALGAPGADACKVAADFSGLGGAPSVSASTGAVSASIAAPTSVPPDPKTIVSKVSIRFPDQEVGNSAEDMFSLTNKDTTGIGVAPAEIVKCDKDWKKCDKKDSDAFVLEQPDAACPQYLASAEHCDYKVLFKPKVAGDHWAAVMLRVNNGAEVSKQVALIGHAYVPNMAQLNGDGSGANNPALRSVIGFDISGASSASTTQKAFVEFDINAPIGWVGKVCQNKDLTTHRRTWGDCEDGQKSFARTDPLNRRWWWFFNPRITSLPQAPTPLSNLNVQGFTDFFNSKSTDIVQGVDVTGGVEYLLVKPRHGMPFFSSYKNAHARMGMALVAGLGATSPFSTPGASPTVFTLAPDSPLRTQFNVPADGNFSNIAFVDRERSRFFRKYYAGIRLKTYHFSDLVKGDLCDRDDDPEQCEGLYNLFPGVIDLTVGQDEQVTGGHLSGWLFRLDAVYPLPFAPAFSIFGSVNSAFQKNRSTNPVILPATSQTPLSDPSVFIVNVDPRSRDVYRIGLGVDILQIIKKATATKTQDAPVAQGVTAAKSP